MAGAEMNWEEPGKLTQETRAMTPLLRNLRQPAVVAAFEGWNDAGDAATEVIEHLMAEYDTELLYELDSEEYYDFQATRPRIELTEEGRELVWPATTISVCHLSERDLVLIAGPEPNMKWRSYCASIVSALRTIKPEMVIMLGAMLTDDPHTRTLPVTGTSTDVGLRRAIGLEPSQYEGPTGIVGVLSDAVRRAGFPTMSLWASVPHYVASPPNPKATLALVQRLAKVLDEEIVLGDLPALSVGWEHTVDELTEEDSDLATYVASLEERHDVRMDPWQLSDTIGDDLADEFERYLRRHENGGN